MSFLSTFSKRISTVTSCPSMRSKLAKHVPSVQQAQGRSFSTSKVFSHLIPVENIKDWAIWDVFGYPSGDSEADLVPFLKMLEIPDEALSDKELNARLALIIPYLKMRGDMYLGYQTNQDLPPIDPIKETLEIHLNNAGDPFIKSYVRASTKSIERAVLRYCAELWGDDARIKDEPDHPDNFWGYVLNMGSTEGNLNALWNARTYVLNPDMPYGGKEPIVILSHDAHYSLPKAADVLRMEMSEKVVIDPWGRVNPEAMLHTVEIWAQRGRSIVAVLNMGTTFTGAYDKVYFNDPAESDPTNNRKNLVDEIHAIAKKYQVPCWVHMDGALGGFIAPFLKEQFTENPNVLDHTGYPEEGEDLPEFGFDFNIQSTNASFYKWFGAPYPCGIFMTQNRFLRPVGDAPAYIGSPDTTLGGGRNAFSGIYMWYSLNKSDRNKNKVDVVNCLRMGRWLKGQLDLIDEDLDGVDPAGNIPRLNADRAPWSFSVTFHQPNDDVFKKLAKFSIPIDVRPLFDENGEQILFPEEELESRCHVYTMQHTYDAETDGPSRMLKMMVRDLRKAYGLNVPEDLAVMDE